MAKYASMKDFEKMISEKLNRTKPEVSPLDKLRQIAKSRRQTPRW